MRKYIEPVFMIGLALLLGLTFKSEEDLYQGDMAVIVNEPSVWQLDRHTLEGDTIIHIAYDPFFNTSKSYRAFPLASNLRLFLGDKINTASLDVIFKCADGYKPHMPLEKVLAGNGYLAYHDMEAPEGKHWPDSLAETLSPFYLVWPDVDPQIKDYARPYALLGAEFKSVTEEFAAAIPQASEHLEGYELFNNTCMTCHSVNKAGGNKAPEFNYPKNITEYWTKENIWLFIQNPTSFRYSSQMPAMTAIDREAFEKIYAYLESMKGQKLREN
ncbi:MAG: cytochrome c [Roseivirga sp.]